MPELLSHPASLALVLAAVAMVVLVLRQLFARPKVPPVHVRVACRSCGWRGVVGKYNRRCSACGSVNLENR
jgi:hypothetical protein